MNAAQVTASQLGAMTLKLLGAKDLMHDNEGKTLRFKIRGSRKVNLISITIDADDTYTMTFSKYSPKNLSLKTVNEFSGVYADNLHSIIESETGLYTRF